jgi:ATP-dependent DNA ligase
VLLQSRRGSLIQRHFPDRFPDLITAAAQLPYGLVLDGEVVVWSEGQLSFAATPRFRRRPHSRAAGWRAALGDELQE